MSDKVYVLKLPAAYTTTKKDLYFMHNRGVTNNLKEAEHFESARKAGDARSGLASIWYRKGIIVVARYQGWVETDE